ncbi:MAG: hypothetical protein KA715_14555 [Xanthomonadaceae bacterium]|nr:hypothetical protein [Xanthomonadaceae bacterium]
MKSLITITLQLTILAMSSNAYSGIKLFCKNNYNLDPRESVSITIFENDRVLVSFDGGLYKFNEDDVSYSKKIYHMSNRFREFKLITGSFSYSHTVQTRSCEGEFISNEVKISVTCIDDR